MADVPFRQATNFRLELVSAAGTVLCPPRLGPHWKAADAVKAGAARQQSRELYFALKLDDVPCWPLISKPAALSPNSFERVGVANVCTITAHPVKPGDAKVVRARSIAAEVETDNDNQVAEKQDAALEVVALPLAVHVAKQEDAKNNSDHVPLREQ